MHIGSPPADLLEVRQAIEIHASWRDDEEEDEVERWRGGERAICFVLAKTLLRQLGRLLLLFLATKDAEHLKHTHVLYTPRFTQLPEKHCLL